MARGRILYVPLNVIIRLDQIKKRHNIKKNKAAWDKMAFLSGVGMNIEDAITIPSLILGGKKR